MTSTDNPAAYDWRLEILDDVWRTWQHAWHITSPGTTDDLAQQIAFKYCEHLNVEWRIHIWTATGNYRHADAAITTLTGHPKPVNQRRRDEPRTCDALCRDIEKDRDRLTAQVEQLTKPTPALLDLDAIADQAEHIVHTRHHADLCACDLWPDDCTSYPGGSTVTTFTINIHDAVHAAAPMILAADKNGLLTTTRTRAQTCGCSCCQDAIARAAADRNPFAGCNCHDYPEQMRCDCPYCLMIQTWGKVRVTA